MIKIAIITVPLAVLGLAAGCSSQGSPAAVSSSVQPTVSHSASAAAAVQLKYSTATDLLVALSAHGVTCGAVTQEGLYMDCGNRTVIQVINSTATGAISKRLLRLNGGSVVVGQNWVVATTPKLAYRVQRVLGGSVIGQAAVSPQQAAQARASASASAAAQAAKQARQRAARQAANTITYVVTGSPANVTYGPAGTDLSGTVPMNVSAPIGNNPASYYAIDAQLNGGGTVTAEILVGGKVISSATASGSYNIATAEIDQNPLTGQWENTNGG